MATEHTKVTEKRDVKLQESNKFVPCKHPHCSLFAGSCSCDIRTHCSLWTGWYSVLLFEAEKSLQLHFLQLECKENKAETSRV